MKSLAVKYIATVMYFAHKQDLAKQICEKKQNQIEIPVAETTLSINQISASPC